MKTRFLAGWRVLALAGLASVAVPVLAAADSAVSMPAEQYQGAVGYVTGGVGQGEEKLFEQQEGSHRLAIMLLERAGTSNEFTADAKVKIADSKGHTMLDARADGPFMLVDLPSGRYSIQATLDNHTLKKASVMVAQGKTAHATFEFPGNQVNRVHVSMLEGVSRGGLGG